MMANAMRKCIEAVKSRVANVRNAEEQPEIRRPTRKETVRMYRPMPQEVLSDTGTVYVTLAAAKKFAETSQQHGIEEARKRLTILLLGARRMRRFDPDNSEWWRHSSPVSGLHIEAKIMREGRLAVVTYVRVRPYEPRTHNYSTRTEST